MILNANESGIGVQVEWGKNRSSSLSAEAEPFIPEHHLGISLVSNKSASMGGNPVWIMFGSKHSKEALPDRPTIYSMWTERDSQIVMFLYEDLHWIRPAQNKAWSWPQFPVANWYFIPWLKHDAWQSEHCNEEVSQKSSVLPVKQCFTNVCSVSESERIDCKTGSDFDWWPALGNPGFAQELCLCWAFAATLSAGPQLLELQDTVPPRLKCKSHSVELQMIHSNLV